jgi:hypothetical protein
MFSGTNTDRQPGGDIQRPGFLGDNAQSGEKKHPHSNFDIRADQSGSENCREFRDYTNRFSQRQEI